MEEFRKYGQMIIENRSKLNPEQQFVFLRWIYNSQTMKIQLTSDKRKDLTALVQRQTQLIMEQKPQRIKSVASFVGKFRFSTLQFKRGGLHLQQINKQMGEAARETGWTCEMIVTKKCLTKLYWWMNQLKNIEPKIIDKRQKQIVIQTDDSISG
ncbi:MAG: hypothetical protein EZS28_033975 [Streblomastix strix]|uniref:Uncharacterized protein n=1 Tax=Streblomastix strix TaxID=222440 RepID=A0A5J4UJ50_9EUKA|nr:MAG: hypothetical protein EZS28_033975 [Streblomastix strix]